MNLSKRVISEKAALAIRISCSLTRQLENEDVIASCLNSTFLNFLSRDTALEAWLAYRRLHGEGQDFDGASSALRLRCNLVGF